MMDKPLYRSDIDDTGVIYPETDPSIMPDGDVQRDAMIYLITALRRYYEPIPDAYITGDIMIYYEKGNPRKSVSPDLVVMFETEKKQRSVIKLWEEGKPPDMVFEIISPTTARKDLNDKIEIYRQLGITEYVLYDPDGRFIKSRLKGYWLPEPGREVMQECRSNSDGHYLICHTLGLTIHMTKNKELRIIDDNSYTYLETPEELGHHLEKTRNELKKQSEITTELRKQSKRHYQQAYRLKNKLEQKDAEFAALKAQLASLT